MHDGQVATCLVTSCKCSSSFCSFIILLSLSVGLFFLTETCFLLNLPREMCLSMEFFCFPCKLEILGNFNDWLSLLYDYYYISIIYIIIIYHVIVITIIVIMYLFIL